MKKLITGIMFFLFSAMLFLANQKVFAAESTYYYSEDSTVPYRGEETFVITCNVTSDSIDLGVETEYSYPEVKKVVFAEGVTTAAPGFKCFPNVETIYLSSTVKKVWFSYSSLSKLKEIKVSGKNKWFMAEKGVLFNKKKTVLVKYPSAVTNGTYTIPDTVTTIEDETFQGTNLKTVTIGAELNADQLEELQYQLKSIKEFKVSGKNTSFCAKEGVLFNKKGDTLLLYPDGKGNSYKVPEGTITIGERAFEGSAVTNIILPEGLTTIKEAAFQSSALTSITIPKTVTSIGEMGFYAAVALKSISVEEGNKQYASYEGILYNTARTKLVYIPEGYNQTVLKLPSALKSLSIDYNNSTDILKDLTEIVIPKALTEISFDFVYHGTYKCFDKITLEEGNTAFSLYQGSLYNKDGTELLLFQKQEKAEFPDTLKTININMLTDSGIKEMDISKNVESIRYNNRDWAYIIPTLEKLTVVEDNLYYICENGMLLNKDKTVLYDIPKDTKELVIPDTVKKVETYPVFYYNNLTKITISKGITELEDLDDGKLDNLQAFTVTEDNPNFTSVDGVLYNKDITELLWYPKQKKDKTFIMPNTVEKEDVISITANPYLESLTLSDSLVEEVSYFVYKENYYIPSKSIKEYIVSDNNRIYKTVDGVLYNKDMTTLIAYPYQKTSETFTIPDTVTDAVGICNNRTYKNDEKYIDTSNPYLKKLTVGKNVKCLFEDSNVNCPIFNLPSLQSIEVNTENKYFNARDGILYNKDFSELYVYPKDCRNTRFIIPKNTKNFNDSYIYAATSPYLTFLKIEKGNQSFYTDGTTLYNYQMNIKYSSLGGEVYYTIQQPD